MKTLSKALVESGYAVYIPNTFRNTSALLKECLKPSIRLPKRKSFITHLSVNPTIIHELRHLQIIKDLEEYLGPTAHLTEVELCLSDAVMQGPPKVAQLYHLDNDSSPQVKMFFLCKPVAPENGPLTFLNTTDSAAVCKRIGYRDAQRLLDSDVKLYHPTALVGDAGTIGFIDTSRCLHFGSRVKIAPRLLLVTQFTA